MKKQRYDGSIYLHPTVCGEGEAIQLLAEEFNHIGALGLAVHEDVEPQGFLKAVKPKHIFSLVGSLGGWLVRDLRRENRTRL